MIYQLYREQQLSCELGLLHYFLTIPGNLSLISPEEIIIKHTRLFFPNPKAKIFQLFAQASLGKHLTFQWKTTIKERTSSANTSPYLFITDELVVRIPATYSANKTITKLLTKKLNSILDYRQHILHQLFNQKLKT